jgi:hypothetical protein
MKFGWFVWGTIVGVTLYALVAQQTGSEVRANIADAATEAKDYVQKTAEQVSQ